VVVVLFVTITEEEQREEEARGAGGKLINRDDREEAARLNRVDVLSNPRAAARRIQKSIFLCGAKQIGTFYVRKDTLFWRRRIRHFLMIEYPIDTPPARTNNRISPAKRHAHGRTPNGSGNSAPQVGERTDR
jgi:hypothetical protein